MDKRRTGTIEGFKRQIDRVLGVVNQPLTEALPGNPRVRRFTNAYGNRADRFTAGKVGRVQDPESGAPLRRGRPVPTAYSGDLASRSRQAIRQANAGIDMFFTGRKRRRR